ncbi:hypothetical protein FNV43_RR14575 [Rhamnella rubrinervis]|uniref:Uncharacterized protein n=1 Tax=Rhamnella rubrinervis TaxID=2594499 RepID=A0A8K0H369_9ROSA|nr:hypothetical protein FNV43_RR14575 [Rhamnella rubrinervis]
MEASVPRHLALKLLVTTILMVILLNTSRRGATAFTVSLTKGNDTAATSICTGTCLVDHQQAELELLMMGSETNRRLQGPIQYTKDTGIRNKAYTCARPVPTCAGPATGAPKGENCYADTYNRNCHKFT